MKILEALKIFALLVAVPATAQMTVEPDLLPVNEAVAIPQDHLAIIESQKVLEQISSNPYFNALHNARLQKLNEQIALSKKEIAFAKMEQSKAERSLAKENKSAPQETGSDSEVSKPKNIASKSPRKRSTPSVLNQLTLLSVTEDTAVVKQSEHIIELSKSRPVSGLQLVSTDLKRNSARVRTELDGLHRDLSIIHSGFANSSLVKPLKAE